ncbi:11370_t:CDS:1 [Funneliformis geosporum]|nr:11370_t:CDS:1 [Funneliformis geosporum]
MNKAVIISIVLLMFMLKDSVLYILDVFLNEFKEGVSCKYIEYPESIYYMQHFSYSWTFTDFQDIFYNPEHINGIYSERFSSRNETRDKTHIWRLVIYPHSHEGIGLSLAPFQSEYEQNKEISERIAYIKFDLFKIVKGQRVNFGSSLNIMKCNFNLYVRRNEITEYFNNVFPYGTKRLSFFPQVNPELNDKTDLEFQVRFFKGIFGDGWFGDNLFSRFMN